MSPHKPSSSTLIATFTRVFATEQLAQAPSRTWQLDGRSCGCGNSKRAAPIVGLAIHDAHHGIADVLGTLLIAVLPLAGAEAGTQAKPLLHAIKNAIGAGLHALLGHFFGHRASLFADISRISALTANSVVAGLALAQGSARLL